MTLRVGFLGTGGWSHAHLYRVRQQPDVVVAACYGSNPDKTRAFKESAGESCIVYADYHEMFPQIDALYVVIPPFAHTGQIREAIEAGIHVFTEKPLARTLAEAEKTAAVADAHPEIRTQMGYMLRFTRAADIMGDFALRRGAPLLFTGRYFCNDLHAHWWRDHAKSGGQLLEQVIHLIDLSCHLFGTATRASYVRENIAHRDVEGYTTNDVSVLTAQFESGALATFAATNQAIPGRWDMGYHVVFERLTAAADSLDAARFWVTDPQAQEEFALENTGDPYMAETADFLAAIREGRPARCPISEGLKALRVIEAAERAAKSGKMEAV